MTTSPITTAPVLPTDRPVLIDGREVNVGTSFDFYADLMSADGVRGRNVPADREDYAWINLAAIVIHNGPYEDRTDWPRFTTGQLVTVEGYGLFTIAPANNNNFALEPACRNLTDAQREGLALVRTLTGPAATITDKIVGSRVNNQAQREGECIVDVTVVRPLAEGGYVRFYLEPTGRCRRYTNSQHGAKVFAP